MLACLRRPGDLSLQLLSHTQMNTGLQKWENTQKMRSAQHPTPAELDAYAKKVANNPLTIKIFPNSVKVPQRKHLRRTVNGLDTSGQRFSPYPTQASSNRGLLAIVKLPTKRIVKDFDGSRARLLPEVAMNPPSSALYAAPSTLSHPQSNPLLQPGLHGYRKMRPDADAPPNVTVSTSTIPLSMAANPHLAMCHGDILYPFPYRFIAQWSYWNRDKRGGARLQYLRNAKLLLQYCNRGEGVSEAFPSYQWFNFPPIFFYPICTLILNL
uniref:Family with sequence similarity 222 member Ba n=1 Tax=Callorhinchus milii TaxID=7868 RepID=A0A4W3JHZ9_CALMI